MGGPVKSRLRYWALVCGTGLAALVAAWSPLATQIDRYATDWLFRLHKPAAWKTEAAILAIDDASFREMGGIRNLRPKLAEALRLVAAAKPLVIAVDVVLADASSPEDDGKLADAIRAAGNVILPAELLAGGKWEEPLPVLAAAAVGLAHVHAEPDADGMSRFLPLEKAAARKRHWALAVEAFVRARSLKLTESPEGLEAGGVTIPSERAEGRLLRIRFMPPLPDGSSAIPHVTLAELLRDPGAARAFAGKAVFVGATAQSATRDRMMTPYTTSLPMPGVEIHAQAYETLAQGRFLTDASSSLVLLLALGTIVGAGLIYLRWTGTLAYGLGAGLIAGSHALPHLFFLNGVIYPYMAPAATAWIAVTSAAVYQYFQTRGALRRTEDERSRYQQAIQFVTHEMRTPLTAIQGSSELMKRYKLGEDKQKELANQIHSESKRLGSMIQTFLDVERLSAGQMELKRDPFAAGELVEGCVSRVLPLAERKQIGVTLHAPAAATVEGDRELMEYAVYNLLTNAVKYSPPETHIDVRAEFEGGKLSIAVADQGIGMNEQELKNIFTKFYRTRKAEESGEVGTGIGLSIVQQIVTHHGGRMQVTSSPGQGSCFTMIVPASVTPVSSMPGMES